VLAGVPRNPTRPDLVPAKPIEAEPAADAAPQPVPVAAPVAAEPAAPGPALPSAAFLPGGTQLVDRPKPPSDVRKRALLLGAVVLVLIVAGVGIYLANLGGGQNQTGQNGGSTQTSQQQGNTGNGGTSNTNSNSTGTTTLPPAAQSVGTIGYSAGANFAEHFYTTAATDPASAWNQLSQRGQFYYQNSEQKFAQYWSARTPIYGGHIGSVTTNSDGSSLNVPIPLTYGTPAQSATVNVKVVQPAGGQLLLDSNTLLPNTTLDNGNSGGANNQ
jgi:hypothetical protein